LFYFDSDDDAFRLLIDEMRMMGKSDKDREKEERKAEDDRGEERLAA
jgi:hypothetical protein